MPVFATTNCLTQLSVYWYVLCLATFAACLELRALGITIKLVQASFVHSYNVKIMRFQSIALHMYSSSSIRWQCAVSLLPTQSNIFYCLYTTILVCAVRDAFYGRQGVADQGQCKDTLQFERLTLTDLREQDQLSSSSISAWHSEQ